LKLNGVHGGRKQGAKFEEILFEDERRPFAIFIPAQNHL